MAGSFARDRIQDTERVLLRGHLLLLQDAGRELGLRHGQVWLWVACRLKLMLIVHIVGVATGGLLHIGAFGVDVRGEGDISPARHGTRGLGG